MTAHPSPFVPAHGTGVHLLIPTTDVPRPEVTILVPALNEELTIGRFVDWCHEGIAASGTQVEILSSIPPPTAPPKSRSPAAPAC